MQTLVVVFGIEKIREHAEQIGAPFRDRAAMAQPQPPIGQGVDQGEKSAELNGLAAGQMTVGQDAQMGLPAVAHEITEQQAIQAKAPTVEASGLDFQLVPMRVIEPPADTRIPDPGVQAWKNGRVEPKAVEKGRCFAQGQDRRRGKTALEKSEQVEKTSDQGLLLMHPLVSDRPRDAPFLSRLAEDAGNRIGIHLDIRGADQDIAGGQVRKVLKEVEQAIMQHLDLTQRRKTAMEVERPIVGMKREAFFTGGGPVPEVEDIVVQGGQQMGLLVFLIQVDFLHLTIEQLPEKILPGFAQRDEQRMALLIVWIDSGLGRQSAFRAHPGQLPGRDQVAPVVAAGAEVKEMHLGVAADSLDDLQVDRGQRVDAEQVTAPGQAVRVDRFIGQEKAKLFGQLCPVRNGTGS